MIHRRPFLTAVAALSTGVARPVAAQESFESFLAGVKAQARREGISPNTVDRALGGVQPVQRVLELDRHQPEFTMTWGEYRAKIVSDQRIADGRAAWNRNRALLTRVQQRFGVDPGVIIGIWGLESNFGQKTGNFNVIEALATLAWDGRRASYFRGQLMNCLKILDRGDVPPERMTGSWAGAMGQPQFMPDSYLTYAVDFEGHGRRDIWTSLPDVFGSIANYLARAGWRGDMPWGQPARVPPGLQSGGRSDRRSLAEWTRLGVRRADGTPFSRGDIQGALVMPDGQGGEAFMTTANFAAIRRYNPSDFYAIAVGLIGDAATG